MWIMCWLLKGYKISSSVICQIWINYHYDLYGNVTCPSHKQTKSGNRPKGAQFDVIRKRNGNENVLIPFIWVERNMRLNISKGTSCRKTQFWVQEVQSQNISKDCPIKSNLRFHIFWNLQCLLLKLLEGFYIKMAFSCKNRLLNCCQYFSQIPKLWEPFFPKSAFLQPVCHHW